ncbi:MAG: hypothetical protein MUO68_00220, partial [Desulfobacteraceae bacterium]|nr:hypothetical protein [Desulfobacteraceae bacterium]
VLRKEFPVICEYEIRVDKKGSMDEISLKLECHEAMDVNGQRDLSFKISERLKTKTNLRFNITFANPGELPRYTLKSKRFRDMRRI